MPLYIRVKKVLRQEKGGPGSGNYGHSGRPGSVGGSTSKGGSTDARPKKLKYPTVVVAGHTVPVETPEQQFLAAQQAGDISQNWKYGREKKRTVYTMSTASHTLRIQHIGIKNYAASIISADSKKKLGKFDTPLMAAEYLESL